MEHVRAAGGVVMRLRADGGVEVAVMRSPYGTWVFPKGRIEPGEAAEEAARRELGEEVGLKELRLIAPLPPTAHEYEAGGRRYRKQVEWFLFSAPPGSQLTANPAERALEAMWCEARAALALLTHADQRRLLRRALKELGPGIRGQGEARS